MNRLVRGALAVLAITMASSKLAHPQALVPSNAPLRPGDRLLVKVWVDTVFADSARIDQSGNVILPRFGSISLVGVSADAVADSVRRAYNHLIRSTAIEVTPLRRITVVGEVKKPGTYYLETLATLRDAMAMAGGVTDIGSTGHIVVIRDSTRIAFDRWEGRNDPAMVVQSGDVLYVDREPWLKRNVFSIISGLGLLLSLIYTVRR
jgi:protein involved in polysaccharide export with SLBB domain